MITHKEFFGSTYPILAAPMNQVSDLKLAISCFDAGIFPSLSAYTYTQGSLIDYKKLEEVIKTFQDTTGSNKILLSLTRSDFLNQTMFDFIINNKISHVEVIGNDDPNATEQLGLFREYKSLDLKILGKLFSSMFAKPDILDGVILKGKDGAGRGLLTIDVDEEIEKIKENAPSLPIIMSGGISTADDVNDYLNKGCMAVAIGTLLAASQESCLSESTKQAMVNASYGQVERFDTGAEQNALIFSRLENDDYNHTRSLSEGLKDPTNGHVFAGRALSYIKSIKSVKEIVQDLVGC